MKEEEGTFKELWDETPWWFKVAWVIATALSLSIGLVLIWAIIQVVLYVIG